MAVNKGEIGIYGVLRRDGGNNILARTDQIQDARTNKTQEEVNQEAFVLSTRVNNINIRVEGLESKISKPINYKEVLKNKNDLDALTGVKHGDMYQVRSAVAINGKKYPENTKFVYVSTHEDGVSEGWWEPFNSITLSTGNTVLHFDDYGNIVLNIATGLTVGSGSDLMVNYGDSLKINDDKQLDVRYDYNSGFSINNTGLAIGTYGCIMPYAYGNGLDVRVRGGLTIESGQYNRAVIIDKGNGLGLDSNNRLEVNISTDDSGLQFENGSLKLSTGSIRVDSSNRLKILYGDGLKIGDDYKLRLNLSSSPLYFDNSKHISIQCGNGLVVGTQGDGDNKLLINPGDSISINSGKVDVNCGSGLVITTRGLNVIAGEGITTGNGKVGIFYDNSLIVGSSKMLSVNTDYSGGISTGRYGLRINIGSTLRVINNNVEINPGLGISTRNGKINVLYGQGLCIDNNNSLAVNVSSGPLYFNNDKLSILCGSGLIISTKVDDSVQLSLDLSSSPLYIDNYDHLNIYCGSGLTVGTNDNDPTYKLQFKLDTSCGLEFENNMLTFNTGSGLTLDEYGHLTIKCGKTLVCNNIGPYESDPLEVNFGPSLTTHIDGKLGVNYGRTLTIFDGTLNVNVSTSTYNDVASDLLVSDSNGLYISSSKLAQFIKQVMATP